jgi:hypothetical protein
VESSNRNLLSFRDINIQRGGDSNYLVVLFDILSPVDLPKSRWAKKLLDVDWDRLFIIATDSFTAPLLYQRILERDLTQWVPDDFLESLHAIYTLNIQRNIKLREILIEAVKILNKGGITPTFLKGVNALFGLLPNAECRMMGDLDLLIPEEHLLSGRELLLAAGYYHEHDGLFKTDNDSALNREHSHIAPLFHFSGYSYLELHRYPNYAPKHPKIIKNCFSEANCILHQKDGCRFYTTTTENRYLYNQIHHYYSALEKARYPDFRYLVEQSYLLEDINNKGLDKIHSFLKQTDQSFESAFLLQNALISDLLNYPIKLQYQKLDSNNEMRLNDFHQLIMFDKKALRKLKISIFKNVFFSKKNINFSWLIRRLFNRKYYKHMIKTYFKVLKDGRF